MSRIAGGVILGAFVMGLALGCGSSKAPAPPGGGAAPKAGDTPKPVAMDTAKLPAVLGSTAGDFNGPHITVWVNGELYIDTAFRDSEDVATTQLRNYLSRMVFQNTSKVRIRADDADPNKASLKAKFELRLADHRRKDKAPAKIAFNELRLMRSPADKESWLLTAEGLELIGQSKSMAPKEPSQREKD